MLLLVRVVLRGAFVLPGARAVCDEAYILWCV